MSENIDENKPHSPAPPLTTDEDEADSFASLWHTAEQQKAARKGFLAGCTHVRSQQQEELQLLRETTRRQHESMTSAEIRGVEKGADGKAFIEFPFPENKPPCPGNYHVFVTDGDGVRPTTAQWTFEMWEILNLRDEHCEVVSFIQPLRHSKGQPVDALALLQIAVNLVDRAYKHNDKEVSEWLAIANKFVTEANALFTGSQASNQSEEQEAEKKDLGQCKECKKEPATVDYNGHGFFVCQTCYDSLTRYFEEEYK